MKIKQLLAGVLRCAGSEHLASLLESGEEISGGDKEKIDTALYCVNAVEDELARYYFPLAFSETLLSNSGNYYFGDFLFSPVKILSVTADGKPVDYTVSARYLSCAAQKIVVAYNYAPAKKGIDGDSSYDGSTVSARMIEAGAASEYLLLGGAMQESETWEGVYREEIDRARKSLITPCSIPPRRWV